MFIGRGTELKRLRRLKELNRPSLVVVKGRRRVGKSTLIKKFSEGSKFISISGNPPGPGVTAQDQRNEFGDQLCAQLHLPKATFQTWSDAFRFLGEQILDSETIILFDEISWMGGADPNFLGSLKTWWDQHGLQKKKLILILCGSVSTWIEENLLSSTGFVGRISLVIHLRPFSLGESIDFLQKKGFKGSTYEAFKIMSVTGGIPWYLDLINVKESAEENIYEICFSSSTQLTNEFQTIFHDLFDSKSKIYRDILQVLIDGMKSQKDIRDILNISKGGDTSKYLSHLVSAGFITDHYQWNISKKRVGKQKLYRLSDCFIRFHLKYIEPNLALIEQDTHKKTVRNLLPGWDSIIGFQIESLLLSNKSFIISSLGMDSDMIVCDNPYLQKPTTRKKGCQIDYLLQTKFNTLVVCEFKFRRNELDSSIIEEMKQKCNNLSAPRGFGKAPVLFHIGGVSRKVEEDPFFYRIVDLRDFFSD